MPNTMDLRSAVECCEALCKFALHHSMCPEGYGLAADHGPYLDPNERANLQKIRNMNTTMLIGLQDASKAGEGEGMTARDEAEEAEEDRRRRGRSPLHLSSGPPSNEVVHEFAKAATSIFQLAVRIKAWVGMTPEERQLDEEINMIRGKRCLLMDSTLTVPTVDQHGNVVQKDFVPASSSISKSFHERQRELEQQRQSHISHKDRNQFLNTLSRTKYGPAQYATEDMDRNRDRNSVNKVQDNGDMGDNNNTRQSIRGGGGQGFDSGSDGSLSMRSSHAVPHARSMDHFAYMEPQLRISKHQPLQHNDNDNHGSYMNARHDFNNSRLDIHCINSSNNSRSSKNSDVPHQKYRKRAKRTQPPGRCLSCDSSDTPEWRRGPDGARTLCNACGLHYAKLLKRQGQGQQQQSSAEASTSLGRQSRMEQLQVITFPLRRPIGSNMLPTTAMANGALATAPTNDALSAGRSVDTHSEQALFPSSIEPKREPSDTAQINSAFISGIEDRKTEVKEEP
ncbi:hypothetical protein BGX28_008234 [Mortierella sp. GBA30]|nr:hypothetical protein BGX28_008234 [Mortierella sp. GBA30]